MMTFLPYSSFTASAKVLDYRRLGKQRVESYQILLALQDTNYGWQNHPIVNMWRGYKDALIDYYSCMCQEWVNRGYNQLKLPWLEPIAEYNLPDWIGDSEVHFSHRSQLYYKKPDYYTLWKNIERVDYVWRI